MTSEMRKAAVLLMSLPQEQAAQLMAKLDPKQVEAVSIEIAKIAAVGGEEQNTVIAEFAEFDPKSIGGGAGGLDVANSLVEKALGKNATGTIDNVRQSIEALPFGFLHGVDSQNLLDVHHRRASADDCTDPLAPAAAVWRRDHRRLAQRSAVGRDPPRGHDGPDQSRDHPGSRARSGKPHVERDEPAIRKSRRRPDRGRDSQRHRSGHRAQPAGKPGPGRSRPGRRDSPLDVRLRGHQQVHRTKTFRRCSRTSKRRNGPWPSRAPAKNSRTRS